MTASTADCKKFLSDQLQLNENGFKRLQKFKEGNAVIREFSHPLYNNPIFITEQNGQLFLTDPNTPSLQKILAGKYVFSLIDENNEDFDENVFLMTRRSFFEKNGHMSDQPDCGPLNFLPEEWMPDDVNDCGTWVLETNLTADEIIATLHDLGCHSDAKFDKLCNGRSALNCPLLTRRTIKDVLNETVAEKEYPTKGPSKI